MTHPLPPSLLELMLLNMLDLHARQDYALHLLWTIGLQLFALSGGSDYPIPSPSMAFAPPDTETAITVRDRLLHRLQGERSDA